jgi:hypothetical protein
MFLFSPKTFPPGVMVALEQILFTVNEEEGAFIEVCAVIENGTLSRDAIVTLQSMDSSATCKSTYKLLVL